MWFKSNFFKYAVGTILVLTIILLLIQIRDVFDFLVLVISAVLIPIVIAVILYYILRPLRRFIESYKLPRYASVTMIFFLFLLAIALIFVFIWPSISQQVTEFSFVPKMKIQDVEKRTLEIMNSFNFTSMSEDDLKEVLAYYLQKAFSWTSANIISTLSSIATIASYLVITPFVLFYLMKDDHMMEQRFLEVVPAKYLDRMTKIVKDVDNVLASFISSQLMVAAIVGGLVLLGYTVIGLNYAFLLALIAFVFNLIPFFGPFIATVPALFIGLSDSPAMAIKVLCIVLVVHLLDLNIISPRVVGTRLKIHPVTIVFLLLASVSVFGFIGLFIAVPVYAALKVIFKDVAFMWKEEQTPDH